MTSVQLPSSFNDEYIGHCIQQILHVLDNSVAITSFRCMIQRGILSDELKYILYNNGLQLYEYHSSDRNIIEIELISYILHITVNDCMIAAATSGTHIPNLVIISNNRKYSNAFNSIKHSNMYHSIILLYTMHQINDSLHRSVDKAINIQSIVYQHGNTIDSQFSNGATSNGTNKSVSPVQPYDTPAYSKRSPSYDTYTNGNGNITQQSSHTVPPPLQHTRTSTVYSNNKLLHRIDFITDPLHQQQLIQCFHSLMLYCQTEHIIPRETVLRKRLLDCRLGSESEFEPMINIAVQNSLAHVENSIPQRVIWPIESDGTVNKFQCVDLYVSPMYYD